MKKYKLIIQIEQIKKYLEQGQLKEAYDLAENVDIKKLKSMSDLGVIAECYFQNKRYAEAKELFEQIYDTVRTRRVLAQIVHLSIKLKDIIEANYYLEEFIKIAPDDFYQYIFRYSIDKLMRKPIDVLIADLERLKEVEYIECWAYELAKLYYKSGNEAACRKECEKIILWFGNGEYVNRAKALLAFYNGELDLEMLLETTKKKDIENKENEQQNLDEDTNELKENTEYPNLEDRCTEENSYRLNEIEPEIKDNSSVDRNDTNEDTVNSLLKEDGVEEGWNLEEKEQGNIDFEEGTNEEIGQEEIEQEEKIKLAAEFKDELEQEEIEQKEIEQKEKIELAAGFNGEIEQGELEQEKINHEEGFKEELEQEEAKQEENIQQETETKNPEQDKKLESEEGFKEELEQEEAKLEENIEQETETKKSKHKLFHKKYDLQEENTGIDDSARVLPGDDTIIGEDTEEDSKSLIHIDLKSNAELIDNLHSKLLPLLEDKNISLSEVFGNFMRIDGLKEDILQSLESMIHSVYGHQNLIIMGSKDSGKTLLAKKYAKLLHRLSFISSPRVALIDAMKLNRMDFISKSHQLKDCIMILQNSQSLTRETLIRLMELQQIPDQNIIYMLTGLSEEMNQLWEEQEDLSNYYPNHIILPQYKVEDYAGFAYDKILEAGYKIEKEAFEYLRDVILDKIKRENSLSEVFSYLNQIILDHEKQNEQVLLELTRKGSLNQFDLSILKKEDIK